MPTITVDIENTEETVTRRVVRDVVYDLISAMGMPYDVNVIYPGHNDPQDLPISVRDTNALAQYDPQSKILLGVEEEYVEGRVPTSQFTIDENAPLFHDPALGIIVAPNYVRTQLRISTTWRFKSASLAHTFIADIRRHATLFRDGLFHEIEYSYLFPDVPLLILTRIHELRENQAGYGQDLIPYLEEHFSDQMYIQSNRSNSKRAWYKGEVQTSILGHYNFEVTPEKPEPGEAKSTHIVTFDYTLQYDKVLAVTMKYPFLIHNQDLGSRYYDTHIPFELGHRLQLPSQTRHRLDYRTNNQFVTGFTNGAPVPEFIDWQPEQPIPGMEGLLRLVLVVSPDAPRQLLNLMELGTMDLKPWLLDYAYQEYEQLTTLRDSVFFVQLHEGSSMVDPSRLVIDEELNVTTTFDLDLRKQYHLWVALVSEPGYLSNRAKSRLLEQGEWAVTYLYSLDPTLSTDLSLFSNGSLSAVKFDAAVRQLARRRVPEVGEARLVNFRLANFIVVTR